MKATVLIAALVYAVAVSAHSTAAQLNPTIALVMNGEAGALKGHVLHVPGAVLAIEGNHAYSPYTPDKPQRIPASGRIISISDCGITRDRLEPTPPLEAGETAVAVAQGSLGVIPMATVVLIEGESPGDKVLDHQLAPKFLRIFDGNREVTNVTLNMPAFPCAVILDDLNDGPVNEIAVVWASVAAGYTIGITVLSIR